jgi:hypothetical protein
VRSPVTLMELRKTIRRTPARVAACASACGSLDIHAAVLRISVAGGFTQHVGAGGQMKNNGYAASACDQSVCDSQLACGNGIECGLVRPWLPESGWRAARVTEFSQPDAERTSHKTVAPVTSTRLSSCRSIVATPFGSRSPCNSR